MYERKEVSQKATCPGVYIASTAVEYMDGSMAWGQGALRTWQSTARISDTKHWMRFYFTLPYRSTKVGIDFANVTFKVGHNLRKEKG